MKKNNQIKLNLDNLFDYNSHLIKESKLQKVLEELINDSSKAFNLNLGIITNLFDDEEVRNFKKAKKNKKLIDCFERAKSLQFNDEKLITELISDILTSLDEIKKFIKVDNKYYENQIVFLEYNYEPWAYFCGFGKGNYSILEKPTYFKFNYLEESYNGMGKVNYSEIWKEFSLFNLMLEDLNIYDQIFDTEVYQGLLNSYKFKTYLLLHESFKRIGYEAFEGINTIKPLYIFGNEHDCEPINICIFE